MKEGIFTYQQLSLYHLEWGTGNDVILCFHGFGRTSADFELFTPLLQTNQRIIAINLLAHGASQFDVSRAYINALQPKEWLDCLKAFLDEKGVQKFHLMGYSMGGRVALCTWEWMPERVKSAILLAPDGLKKSLLYQFASGTRIGRAIYRSCIENPNWLFSIANQLHRLKILHPKLFRFLHVHLDTRSKRQQVYDAWLAYRAFFPNLARLGQIHSIHSIPVFLLFGKNDSIIRPDLATRLTSRFKTPVKIIILPSGHRLFHQITLDAMIDEKIWPGQS
ncbi:MAG: hypothetical protein RLZZ262_102 [Bacteroidota bacterium]